MSIALKTSPINVHCTGSQFLLQLTLPILPVDRVKDPQATGQIPISILWKLLVAASLELLFFVPLTRDLAAQTWTPHPVVEAMLVCAAAFICIS